MLHWLAGQRAPDGPNDPDTTGYIEPPETPAPVFAVRAFKHAIFGTPQTAQPNPRRNSNTENSRPRNGEPRPSRPGMARPKSASDALALGAQAYVEPLSSPTKSILVREGGGTPGGKKKNVTFGDHVLDNEEKRPLKSGLPDDCPGKFPSPGHRLGEEVDVDEEKVEKGKGKNKLTEAFEQARDESKKRKSKKSRRELEEEHEVPPEFREPKSESGKYWKSEYDIYRTNTQREVKKLITKQKAAKSYALTKDIQCTELADQLREEQRKVEELGTKTAELSAQMREMEEKLKVNEETEKRHLDEIAMLKRQLGRRDSARPTSSDGRAMSMTEKPERSRIEAAVREPERREQSKTEPYKRINREVPKPEADPVQRPSEPYKPSAEPEKPRMDIQTLRARLKAKQEPPNPRPAEDIWAQSFGSSGAMLARSLEKPPPSPKASRAVTSEPDVNPLKTLDINSLPLAKDSRRTSSLGSMEVECKSTPDLDRVDSKNSTGEEANSKRLSPLASPSLPLPSASDLHSATSTAVKQGPVPRKGPEEKPDISFPITTSSPFQIHAKSLPSRPAVAPSGPRDVPPFKPAGQASSTKENVSPSSKPQTPQHHEPKEKPSVLWSSINAPQVSNASAASTASKRNTSLTGKDGKEVSLDRLEAARARVNARGRVTT